MKKLGVPCAHAPAFSPEPEPFSETSPKAAAEELGYTFLPCVLVNLHKAPQFLPLTSGGNDGLGIEFTSPTTSSPHVPGVPVPGHGCILAEHVDCVIVPAPYWVVELCYPSSLGRPSDGCWKNTSVMQAEAASLGPVAGEVVHQEVTQRLRASGHRRLTLGVFDGEVSAGHGVE